MRTQPATGFFAISVASVGIWSLVYGALGPPGLTVPDWMPAGVLWSDLFALCLLAFSAGLLVPRLARVSTLAIGAFEVLWAIVDVPPILAAPLSLGSWYGLIEALTCCAATGILYAEWRRERGTAGLDGAAGSMRAARVVFGWSCVFYGVSHFVYADYTASMVPLWLSAPLALAYLTGAGHLAAGVALIVGILPRLAATLEAVMMTLFGLMVWVPSFFTVPRPSWATPPENQWLELVVNLLLASSAFVVAASLRDRPWGFAPPRAPQ